MSGEAWLAFVAASALMQAVPGPTVLLVVACALRHGRGSGWWTVPGVALGDATALAGSLAGLGALLAASPSLFAALRWLGAAYLIILGVRLWRRAGAEPPADGLPADRPQEQKRGRGPAADAGPPDTAGRRVGIEAVSGSGTAAGRWMLVNAYAVTALNPKGIAFFVAFLPHFVASDAPVAPQLALLGATFVALAAINAAAYACLAGSFTGRSGRFRALRHLAAAALITAGVIAAVAQAS